jgi:hypothetical protein
MKEFETIANIKILKFFIIFSYFLQYIAFSDIGSL